MTPKEAPWYVYILHSPSRGLLYVGCTPDIAKRLDAHNTGKGAKWTRGRGPWEVVYQEKRRSRSMAQIREAEIKKMTRADKWALIQAVNLAKQIERVENERIMGVLLQHGQ